MAPKGRILHVGIVTEDGTPIGWVFETKNQGAAFNFTAECELMYAGYTVNELQAIAERRNHGRTD